MKKWKPDLSPEQFQEVIQSESHPPMEPFNIPGKTQEGAWYWDSQIPWVRIPWRKFTGLEGVKLFGQTIMAHDTHRKILDIIHSRHSSILDVGGYDGIWAWLFEAERKVVLDVCQEALERWAATHAEIVCDDGRNIGKLFQPNEFDVVFLIDVLEHMHATSALRAIKAAEKVAKHQVIVATPDGYQPFDDWQSIVTKDSDVPCAELMAHRSGWKWQFFRDRGYKILLQPDLHTDIGGGDGFIAWLNKE